MFKFEKKHYQSGSKYSILRICTVKHIPFSGIATVWLGLEAQFSQLIKNQMVKMSLKIRSKLPGAMG